MKKVLIIVIAVFLYCQTDYASIIIRVVGVNPSPTETQVVPMKTFLPSGIKPEDIIYANGMALDYDPDIGAYFLYQDIEVEPNGKVVKEIEINDIWTIPEEALNALSSKAEILYNDLEKGKDTVRGKSAAEKGKEIVEKIRSKLGDIARKQSIKLSPKEHISVFQDNQETIRSIENDILLMEKLFSDSEFGELKKKVTQDALKSKGLFQPKDESKDKNSGKAEESKETLEGEGSLADKIKKIFKGSKEVLDETQEVKASRELIWRVILIIIIFLGVLSAGFFLMWFNQVEKLKKENLGEDFAEEGKKTEGKK